MHKAIFIAASLTLVACEPAPVQTEAPTYPKVRRDRFDVIATGGCKATARFTNVGTETIELGQVRLLIRSGGEVIDDDESLFDIHPLAPGQSTTWETLFRCPRRSGRIQYEMNIVDQGRPVTLITS